MIVVNTLIDVRELKNECIKTKSSVYYDVDAPEYKWEHSRQMLCRIKLMQKKL